MNREEDKSKVKVRSYSKLDDTRVSGYTRANGNKRKILKEERKLKADSKDLVKDTRDDEYNKAQYDLERIDTTSAELKPELPVADKKHQIKMEEKAAKQKVRAERKARREAKKEEKQKLKVQKEKLEALNTDTRVSNQQARFMSQEWKAQRLAENQAAWRADEERRKRETEINHQAEEQARKDVKDAKGAGFA